MEAIIGFLRNSKKNRITIWPSYPIPGCIHKGNKKSKSAYGGDTGIAMFTAAYLQ